MHNIYNLKQLSNSFALDGSPVFKWDIFADFKAVLCFTLSKKLGLFETSEITMTDF